jgi:hypothetical protein
MLEAQIKEGLLDIPTKSDLYCANPVVPLV